MITRITNASYQIYNNIQKMTSNTLASIRYKIIGDAGNFTLYELDKEIRGKKIVPDGKAKGFRSLGLLGNIQCVAPDSKEDLEKIVKAADSQPEGRRSYQPFKQLNGGSNFFAETGPHAHAERKLLLPFLSNQSKYVDTTLYFCERIFPIHKQAKFTNENISFLLINIFAKNIFGMNEASPEVMRVINSYMKAVTQSIMDPLKTWMPFFYSASRTARNDYIHLAKQLLAEQQSHIIESLNTYTGDNDNLVIATIADLLQRNHPEWGRNYESLRRYAATNTSEIIRYMNHPDVIGLFAVLGATENLTKAILRAIKICNHLYEYYLLKEINDKNIYHIDTKVVDILREKDLPVLFDISQKAIENNTSTDGIFRYIEKKCKIDGIKNEVPANTSLVINLTDDDGNTTTPFSQGPRMCPAARISQPIINTILVYMITHFTFDQERTFIPRVSSDDTTEVKQEAKNIPQNERQREGMCAHLFIM